MKKIAALAALVFVLTGCASTMQNRAQLAAMDEQTCQNYGFQPGTDSYARCKMELDILRQQDTREQSRIQTFNAAAQRPVAKSKLSKQQFDHVQHT